MKRNLLIFEPSTAENSIFISRSFFLCTMISRDTSAHCDRQLFWNFYKCNTVKNRILFPSDYGIIRDMIRSNTHNQWLSTVYFSYCCNSMAKKMFKEKSHLAHNFIFHRRKNPFNNHLFHWKYIINKFQWLRMLIFPIENHMLFNLFFGYVKWSFCFCFA